MSPTTGHVGAPNPHFTCTACGRNLWKHRQRLRNPNGAPAMFLVAAARLCQRCFLKTLEGGAA